MKNFLIIAVLFCLSAMTFKTEAEEIKDKDFIEFFNKFQEKLKIEKGGIRSVSNWDFNINFSVLKKQSKSVKDFVDNHFCAFISFLEIIQYSYLAICDLNQINKYEIYLDEDRECESWHLYPKKNKQYNLEYYDHGCDNDEYYICGCTFGKNNGKWEIIDFYCKE